MDDIEKLNTPIEMLTKDMFYSKLTLEKINYDQWNNIQKVIKLFDMKILRHYHDLYLKIDVYGLADVFQYYRDT